MGEFHRLQGHLGEYIQAPVSLGGAFRLQGHWGVPKTDSSVARVLHMVGGFVAYMGQVSGLLEAYRTDLSAARST